MIHVIASIRITTGRMDDAQKVYETFTPQVNAEKGCGQYLPTFDLATDLPTQHTDADVITVIEKWESMEDFRAHLQAPHVVQFRSDMQGIMADVTIKVLRDLP